eukprot:TRINITY_DN3157_c0_g2_i1.p1 TRINITY_DN3157_c0_g2~~TRINITY_DN3157_c0_g2_i1.p1  ORF type:complete len:773 (-),score=115.55 TRINITY_DN3157_c0_g2_i1:683-3001(-)
MFNDFLVQTPSRRTSLVPSRPHGPWRGVNLGGWLLLEPGTAKALFAKYRLEDGGQATCEWDLMLEMRRRGVAKRVMAHHRNTFVTKHDFQRIRQCGLNAVRIPIGYWCLLRCLKGEPYIGGALKYVDRAVAWAAEVGLAVVLDLHGNPGGESDDAPCGRRQRPHGLWHWKDWDMSMSLDALALLARRYAGNTTVAGIEVCNEPSNTVPAAMLCQYYDRAVETIRGAGMGPDDVAVVLPLFQRPTEEFAQEWSSVSGDRHANVCFDFHYYHCFENEWNGKSLAQQIRSVEEHASELAKFPAIVGEWSLALGLASRKACVQDDERRRIFGRLQLDAYKQASHGWFFWNWTDSAGVEWDWQQSFAEGSVHGVSRLGPLLLQLPAWDGRGEDPLEDCFDPAPNGDACIRYGDAVYLRSFHGRTLDVEGPGSQACARWADKGEWQRLVICRGSYAADSDHLSSSQSSSSSSSSSSSDEESEAQRSVVFHGDIVSLKTHTGHFVSVTPEGIAAGHDASDCSLDASIDFFLHIQDRGELRHRSGIFLQSRRTDCVVDVDGSASNTKVQARWQDFGEWQRFVVEKASPKACDDGPREVKRTGRKSFRELWSPIKSLVVSDQCGSPSEPTSPKASKQRARGGGTSCDVPSPATVSTCAPSSPSRSPSLSVSSSTPCRRRRRRTSCGRPSVTPGCRRKLRFDADLGETAATPTPPEKVAERCSTEEWRSHAALRCLQAHGSSPRTPAKRRLPRDIAAMSTPCKEAKRLCGARGAVALAAAMK